MIGINELFCSSAPPRRGQPERYTHAGACGKVGTMQAPNVERLVPNADRTNSENLLQRSRKALIKLAWITRLAASVRLQPLRSGAFEFPRSAVWAGLVPCLFTGSGCV